MGVPAFFRWLSKKYPSIVVHCVEEKPRTVDGWTVPVDNTKPNPNGIEFDNLYLDMNGIIHPCCHPEDKPAPTNEDEMMVDIFEYIDRLFAIVRPRKLLYMAIDGVAPRAKMNQQRSRRFRASKESSEKRDEITRVKDDMRSRGLEVPADKPEKEHFDSNCITPGTDFMFRLADCLRYYIYHRLNTDPAWANIMVILSDANVPGEGEHKIMDFIRRQRAQPDHDPNTHHCLCGADADLIMLGLATHEPNFTIIREEFKPNKPRSCEVCGQLGHEMKECTGAAKEKCGEHDELQAPIAAEQEFIFLRLNVLREYLYNELTMTGLPFQQDLERAIDDWVLMCFFVGNDFLPHLPSLEIREGAIDRLIRLYKQAVYKTGGYLTENGSVNLARVQLILTELGEVEDEIFKKRRETDLEFKRRDRERNKRQRRSEGNAPMWRTGGQYEPAAVGGRVAPISNPHQTVLEMRQQAMKFSSSSPSQNQSNRDAAAQLKAQIHGNDQGVKRKSDVMETEDDEAEPNDEVKLWEDGWKDRYYQSKFGVGPEDLQFRHTVGNAYVLGMCWVFKYYYQGCASWDWYFPYHYAPFASDFVNIGDLNTEFEPGTKPFRPLEQLMSVFPAASKQFLPPSWQTLMEDPESPIIDFYPEDFRIDLNGKKYAWQGVALLPFVDEQRLLETLSEVYPHLTALETRRNTLGSDKLFIGSKHPARDFSVALYEGEPCNASNPIELDPSLTSGVRGNMWCDEHAVIPSNAYTSPLPQCEDFVNSGAISVNFRDPQYAEGFIFPVKMLKNAKMPERVLKPEDFNRRYPGQQYRPQIGFNRNSGHRPTDPSAANRFIRAGVGSYSNVAPPGRFMTPPGRSGSNYGAPQPPMSWQRSLQGQATAYNRNQQQLGHQHTGYGPPRGYGSQRPSYDTASGSGYGVQRASPYGSHSGYSRSQSSIESYSTRGGSAYPGGSYQNEQRGRQSHYPYPPQRRY